MEDEVGRILFERDNRMVKLTEAGFLFRDYAKTMLDNWQILKDKLMDEHSTLSGEISIYCSVTASLSILPDILGAFRSSYPEIHIRLQTGDASIAIQKVAQGETDIAVAALPESLPNNLDFRILTDTALVFIAPKIPWEFSGMREKPIQWDKIPMILSEHGLTRKKVDAWFRKKKMQPNIYAQVSGHEAILSMVSLGCGVGAVPKLVVDKSPLKNNVIILDIEPKISPYAVGICVQRRKLKSRLVQAFWGIVP